MGKRNRPKPEFRREAVGLALTSGRSRQDIAEDLGNGLSALTTQWLEQERDAGEASEAPLDLHAKIKRLRRTNAVLKQEHDILKKAVVREGLKSVKFAFIAWKVSIPISRTHHILGVSKSCFFAWQERQACRCQQQEMVCLAHTRTAFALSNGTYGSPART